MVLINTRTTSPAFLALSTLDGYRTTASRLDLLLLLLLLVFFIHDIQQVAEVVVFIHFCM